MMGELIGHPDRAAAENARLDAAIARARAAASRARYRVLALSRRGWVSGGDSLTSSLLDARPGCSTRPASSAASSAVSSRWSRSSPASRTCCWSSSDSDFAEDQGRAFLLHPALEKLYPPDEAHRRAGAADRVRRADAARRARPAHRRDRAREPLTCCSRPPRCGCWSERSSIDALIGDPAWLWRRVPHPVAWLGALVDGLDRALNRATWSDGAATRRGRARAAAAGRSRRRWLGWLIETGLRRIPYGEIPLALVASVFLAQRSLYQHVGAVHAAFADGWPRGGAPRRRADRRARSGEPRRIRRQPRGDRILRGEFLRRRGRAGVLVRAARTCPACSPTRRSTPPTR